MSDAAMEQAIQNASASVEMEGLSVDNQAKAWCRQLLQNEITMQEYIGLVKAKAGVGT